MGRPRVGASRATQAGGEGSGSKNRTRKKQIIRGERTSARLSRVIKGKSKGGDSVSEEGDEVQEKAGEKGTGRAGRRRRNK